uniref:RBR-type E3 ubiquitin transferase n=1 Tax=Anopheles atroparvus TaxID=41427 RepID=A0AAG5DTU1_ANOAO
MSNFRQSNTTPSSMDSGPTSRFRTARNMPSWVNESSDRVGPPPPPPPIIPTDPEYEVIDVANQQQYSNAPPPVPLKSPDIKRITVMKCDLCGSVTPIVRCEQCDSNLFCASCDDRYHRHPKRQSHARKPIEPPPPAPSTVKPPLPPKGEAGVGGPLPPPRKNKRPGSFHFPSPLLGRKQDQTIPTTVPQGQPEQQQQQQQQKPPPPPPSPALSLREKMNSLKRFIHPSNRPLPDPPENKIHSSNSSLDTVSKRSPSVGMSRAVSTTMEKIQNNTAATLDRMTLLQQRYRQHQETMKSGDGDRSRRASLTSNTDLQRSEFGDSPPMMPNAPRSLSTSVFNLHQPPPQQQPNMWGFNPLHQAQSMAHFNPMQWNQMNAWMARGSQNGSNMSLNLPSASPHGFPQDPSGYPPAWTNAWGGMYPYPMGMMPMMPGVAMPPPRSRANSRSRAASPALSVKSRKSTMSMRNLNRNSFVDDLTDDEDSDDEFQRTRGRGTDRRRRERLNSTSSIDFDEPEPQNQAFVRASSVKHSRFNRDRRGGGSSARSLIDYPVSRKPAAARYDREELTRDRFDKMALSSPRKAPSDSFTNESEPEQEGKRRGSATGRARSSNDGFSSPRKVTSDSLTNDSDADFERRRQAKLRAAQNNLVVSMRRPTSDSLTNDSEPDHERRQQAGKVNKPVVTAPSKKQSSDSDGRDKPQRKISTDSMASGGKNAVGGAPGPVPKKIPSDSHTPDTDGEQKRRFATKQQRQRKHSSTEFIANESDEQEQTRAPAAGKRAEAALAPERPTQVVNGLLEFRTISPSKSDSDEQRHLKTVEIKNIINEDDSRLGADFGRSVLEDSPPPPAPVAPSCEWQCEFCTYVNEPGVKICAICCKTVTIGVVSGVEASKQDNTQSRSPPPDVVQEAPHVTEVKLQIVPPQKQVNDDAGRSDVDDEEDHEMDTGMTVVVGVGKPGGDVGGGLNQQGHMDTAESAGIRKEKKVVATLVEKKVARAKVSTGCGPSPPREIVGEPKRATVPVVDRPGSKASTGTSPPPQDMSTQTYDTFEQIREEIAALDQTADKPINRTDEEQTEQHQQHDQNIASSLYKRSYSLATPQLLQVDRPASRNSISSDTQSLPPSPHELSPQPGLQSSTRFQANTALNQTSHPNPSTPSASSSSAHYGQQQDETLSYLDRAIHQIIQTAANESRVTARRPTVDDSKYRTFGDLRRIAEQPSVKVATVETVTKGKMQPNKSMPPSTMDDQIDSEDIVQERGEPSLVQNGAAKGEPESEMTLLLREAERYQFTAEELQAALTHCGEKHPVQWLRGNWNKLIETVQTLATKYGHEKRENTIGTISTTEAREALRQHRGNIWRAITECIEQRQRKYREIAKQGNFTREDIVTSLTAHHGNLEQAMVELSKTQLKPFLMRIWGPPNGADNDSGNLPLLQQALREDRSGINSDIQQFISAHVEQELLGDGCSSGPSVTEETPAAIAEQPERIEEPEEQAEPEIAALTSVQDAEQREEVCEEQPANSSNTEILKDIEALIQQMERNQESTNAPVLRNIQQLLTQLVQAEQEPHGSRSPSVTSVRSQASDQRIMSKSPIPVVRPSTTIQHQAHPGDSNRTIEDDVRDFVEQNIQDILPNLVQQVRQELDSVHEDLRSKPTRTLEDDIRETLLRADYSDSDYSNIHYFPFGKPNAPSAVFPERQTTTVKEVTHRNGPVMVEDEQEYVNIQQFLRRAITNERTTTAFDRYKRRNYQIDSSSDEARQTAESTDYYDLVSINEKLMSLFNKPPSKEHETPEPDAQTINQPAEMQAQETTIVAQAVLREQVSNAKVDIEQPSLPVAPVSAVVIEKNETLPTVEATTDKKGMKKRRVSRVPMNKNNYLSRRPVKSSSESDFEGLTHNAKPNASAIVAIDHVEELRHVVENIEQIERTVEAEDAGNAMEPVDHPVVGVEEIEEPIYINLPPKPEPVDGEESSQPVPEPVPSNSTEIENVDVPSVVENRKQEIVVSVPEETIAPVEDRKPEQAIIPSVTEEAGEESSPLFVSEIVVSVPEETIAPVEDRKPEQEIIPSVTEEAAEESSPPLKVTTNESVNMPIAPIEPRPEENGVDSPKNNTEEVQANDAQNDEAQHEVLVHSAKLSNNLSELVLDTKRLIQQMKDEINSDIATFNEDDAAYEDDFYEDEYEDEWEGEEEEEEEEWDSNEEYDVDENGDFLEYEDDDDDGSVMFSEMTIIDSNNGKSRSVEQSQHTEELEPVPEPLQEMILPKINLAVVRENERNSASEVSDLPLDSDFNDALSVIEHSVSEMRNMLQLTEEALGPLPDLAGPMQHASSVETLQNSPEQSEISEITLVPDVDNALPGATEESSEQTLVAEENQPMTMREVQILLNAKAVIGGFLKNVQQIEQIIEETIEPVLDPVELPEIDANAPALIYDSVRTTSTEATDNRPASVIERNVVELHGATPAAVTEQTTEIIAAQKTSLRESHNGTNGSLSNECNTHPAHEMQMSAQDASGNTVLQSSSTLAPVAVILDVPPEGLVENDVQNLSNAIPASENRESIILSDHPIQEDNLQPGAAPVSPVVEMVPQEQLPSITDNAKQNTTESRDRTTDTQTTTLAESTEPEEIVTPEYVNLSVLQTMDSLATTPDYATVIKAGSQMQVVENESNDEREVQNPTLYSHASDTENVRDLEANSVQPNKSPEQNGNTTQNSTVVHRQAALTADESELILSQNTQVLGVVKTAVDINGYTPTDSVEPEALTSTESSSSVQQNSIVEQNQPVNDASPVDRPSEPTSILTNGFANIALTQVNDPNPDTITDRSTSRASSEEPSSSFVEVQPSQVIVHSPHPSPPEAPPRTTNIYQNVDILPPVATTKSPSVRKKASSKLNVKITNANTLQSDDGASPTTPPTPTGSKANAKASKTTKTDAKKKSAGNTTPTTTNTTTADSSGRKQSIVRKKSIGSPFGTVQTNTVKAMQKEFLSKAKESPKPSTSKVSPKPSKLVQPKLFTGGGRTSASSTPAPGSSKASTPASDGGASSSRSTPGLAPSEPGPSSSYTCEKMLKKKYRETCFSDDYQTTDDEDESRMTITESERTIIKSLIKPYEPDSDPPEVQAQKILDDGLVQNFTQAELAVQLIELRYARDSAIWAATQCHTVDEAKDLLQKECELCLGVFPMNEIVSMLKCTHTCCLECAKEYFTQEIANRSITNCNCPYCKEPDLNGPDVTEDDVLEYFSNLDILLKSIVDETVHDLFQRKIRDRTLTQDPNFKWCVHCSSGFFARPKQRRLTCPDCGSITCASCRKPWESQHEGLSCEKYAEWKEANDPELQAEGVQRHLQTHGISCPNCKFRYSLARGGCMHFTCTQCKFEFCYGCNKPFMMGAKCSVSPYCAKLGLHAHHPRNCLFYLRDKEPRDLQNLLLMNNVPFDTEPSEAMKQELVNGQNSIPKCPIPLQKETPAGLMDMICSAEVPEKHAGLCRTHYVEYLVGTVSKAQIDPLPILDLTDCVQELRRRGIPLPERGPWDTDQIYREMCQKIVKDQIPLNN